LGARARQDLQEVRKAAERMSGLTRQLLAFSRQQLLQPETIDLNAAVVDGRSLLQRLIGTSVEMELELSQEPLWVRADPAQLLQVLMNLSINARDAMPDGGRLVVRTAARSVEPGRPAAEIAGAGELEPGPYVELSVRDSGAGIPPEHLVHVFEPFFTTKDVGQGTGLGLATVHGIVSQSQGHIWVESQPGQGATFRILFPAAPMKAVAAGAVRRISVEEFRPARILVVDDDELVRKLVVRTLVSEGYDVLQARNGRQAFEFLDRELGTIDVVVTDVVMPILGGRQYGERLTEEYPDVPIVWMSGYPRDGVFLGEGVAEGQPFLQKPIPADVLLSTVRDVLAARRIDNPRTGA
jgi:CheY-like chemotaxis protein